MFGKNHECCCQSNELELSRLISRCRQARVRKPRSHCELRERARPCAAWFSHPAAGRNQPPCYPPNVADCWSQESRRSQPDGTRPSSIKIVPRSDNQTRPPMPAEVFLKPL